MNLLYPEAIRSISCILYNKENGTLRKCTFIYPILLNNIAAMKDQILHPLSENKDDNKFSVQART